MSKATAKKSHPKSAKPSTARKRRAAWPPKRFMWMDTPLQPLRIPTGWTVAHNDGLYEIDPVPDKIPDEERACFFREDMLQMENQSWNRLLDVGWYPEGDLECGRYALHIHEGDWNGRLLHEFRTRDRQALVIEIERVFNAIKEGQL